MWHILQHLWLIHFTYSKSYQTMIYDRWFRLRWVFHNSSLMVFTHLTIAHKITRWSNGSQGIIFMLTCKCPSRCTKSSWQSVYQFWICLFCCNCDSWATVQCGGMRHNDQNHFVIYGGGIIEEEYRYFLIYLIYLSRKYLTLFLARNYWKRFGKHESAVVLIKNNYPLNIR